MLAITTLFLFFVFAAAEFYRFRRRVTGVIRQIRPLEGDPAGLTGMSLQVITSDSREVTAFISGCQMCVSRIEVGAAVSLIPGPNGYLVRQPWIPACRAARPRTGKPALVALSGGREEIRPRGVAS